MKKLIPLAFIFNMGCSSFMMNHPPSNEAFAQGAYNSNCTTSAIAPVVDVIGAVGAADILAGSALAASNTTVQSTGNPQQDQTNIANANAPYVTLGIAAVGIIAVEIVETAYGVRSADRCQYQKDVMNQREKEQKAAIDDATKRAEKDRRDQENAVWLAKVQKDQELEEASRLEKERATIHAKYCLDSANERHRNRELLAEYNDLYNANKEWVAKSCKTQDIIRQNCTPEYVDHNTGLVHGSVCTSQITGSTYKCSNKDRPRKIDGSFLSDQDAEAGNFAGVEKDVLTVKVHQEDEECK